MQVLSTDMYPREAVGHKEHAVDSTLSVKRKSGLNSEKVKRPLHILYEHYKISHG